MMFTRRLQLPQCSFLLETWVLHELRAAVSYGQRGGELSSWHIPGGTEIDFASTRGRMWSASR